MITYTLHFVLVCINGICPQATFPSIDKCYFGPGQIAAQLQQCSNGDARLRKGNFYKYEFKGKNKPLNGEVSGEASRVIRERNPILQERYNHLVMIIPNGAVKDPFFGQAGMPGTEMKLNDQAECSTSLFLHEFGHNLGLGHAHLGVQEYGDTTGLMGYSWGDGIRRACYNAFNHYFLGWHLSNTRVLFFLPQDHIRVYSLVNHNKTQPVIYKYKDMYWQYNHAVGFNSDTDKHKNEVVIVSKGRDKTDSYLLGGISKQNPELTFGGVRFRYVSTAPDASYITITVTMAVNGACPEDDGSFF